MTKKEFSLPDIARPMSPASIEACQKDLLDTVFHKTRNIDHEQNSLMLEVICVVNARFKFDFQKNLFAIINRDDLILKAKEKFPQISDEELSGGIENFLATINENVKKILADQKADEIKIFDTEVANFAVKKDEIEKYFIYSNLRQSWSYDDADSFYQTFVKGLLIDEIVLKALNLLAEKIPQLAQEAHYSFLQAKYSASKYKGYYLRDDCLVIGAKLFQVDKKITDFFQSQKIEKPTYWDRKHSCFQDLQASGFDDIQTIPFMLEGGDLIICEDRKLAIISISDGCFDDVENHFVFNSSVIIDEDGAKKISDEKALEEFIKSWFATQGYRAIIVKRNLEKPISEIYHLDVFMNVATNFLVMPTVASKVISPESEKELVQEFGEENIVRISDEDRVNLAANFIKFGNAIIFSAPAISPDLIKNFQSKGFIVALPPFKLSLGSEEIDGLRCRTQISPKPTAAAAMANVLEADSHHKRPRF